MAILLMILYVLVCLFLIMVVLLQQGKGADLAGAFGGGGSQTSFGPRSGTTLMHKLTTGSFVLFVILAMSLAILQGKRARSVMEDVKIQPTPVPAPAEAGQVPAAAGETAQAEEAGEPAPDTGQPATENPEEASPASSDGGRPAH